MPTRKEDNKRGSIFALLPPIPPIITTTADPTMRFKNPITAYKQIKHHRQANKKLKPPVTIITPTISI